MRAYASSDYAGLEAGRYHFYYGYEKTWCRKHEYKDCECEDTEWVFEATKDGKIIARYHDSQLGELDTDDMMEGIVRGMGLMFESVK